MILFRVASLLKLVLGALIVLLVYLNLDVEQDGLVAIGLGLLGIFLASWGASYFLLFGLYRLLLDWSVEALRPVAYKLSVLFGLFCLLNLGLFLVGSWSRALAFGILALFVGIQVWIFRSEE